MILSSDSDWIQVLQMHWICGGIKSCNSTVGKSCDAGSGSDETVGEGIWRRVLDVRVELTSQSEQ